jgi:ABC-type nickel/cobalt efflux system permease component RcnA
MESEDFGTEDRTGVRSRIVGTAIALFAVIAALIGFDITADYRSGTNTPHVMAEASVMVLALVGLVMFWRQFRRVQDHAEQLSVDLESAEREAQRFREEAREALRGLGEAIDHQFVRWELSPAERRWACCS